MTFDDFLTSSKIFIFSGNGGTGKTTLSAAWAREALARGKNVGLITIDPSRRLGEAFGMDVQKESEHQFRQGEHFIDIFLIDSQKIIKEFVEKEFSPEKFQELSQNRLFRQVSTILSENQSVSTIYKLAEMIRSNKYDILVVDTPPANHTLDFFRSPENVFRIFKENVVAKTVLEAKSFKFWSSKKLFGKVLSFLVGDEFVSEMEGFFSALLSFQEHILNSAQVLRDVLKGPSVAYFIVTLPEENKVAEVRQVLQDLRRQGIAVKNIIINRAFPEWLDAQKTVSFGDQDEEYKMYSQKIWQYYQKQQEIVEKTLKAGFADLRLYFLPEKAFFKEDFNVDEVRSTLTKVLQHENP